MQKGNEIFTTLYSPNTVEFTVDGIAVVIEEKTKYPFEDTVTFRIGTEKPVSFVLLLRIPAWSRGATVTVNGREEIIDQSGIFYKFKRVFADGDEVVLHLNPQVKAEMSSDGGVSFMRGPLVFALGLPYKEEKVKAEGGDGTLCNYNLTTAAPWNYGIDVKESIKDIRCERKEISGNPWTLAGAPVQLKVAAHEIKKWQIVHAKNVTQIYNLYDKLSREKEGDFTLTPPLPQEITEDEIGKPETITLVPVGAAKLRVTVFPKIVEGIER